MRLANSPSVNFAPLRFSRMTSQNSLSELPLELWDLISSHLPNRDVKSLRLTCRQFRNAATLRIRRVFLSANSLNIEVFRAIAAHNSFRQKVTEIVWDDVRFDVEDPRFMRYPHINNYSSAEEDEDEIEDELDDEVVPQRFRHACKENLEELRDRKGHDVDRPDHVARADQVAAQLPLSKCWEYYQHLLRQQEEALAANSDVDAFLYGLKQFPSLKRVTVTPAAHGHLFAPLYPTPMIRAFPKGFNYPIPRGWPTPREDETPQDAYVWATLDEAHRDKYRGFRIVTRVLAKEPHNVSELVMNANQLPTGINCTIFDHPCEEYDNLVTILRRPGFRRLDLALMVAGIDDEELNWRSYRNGKLRQALSAAKDMEHFSLHTTVLRDPSLDRTTPGGAGSLRHFVPLQSIFPVEEWSRLRHFELSHFLVVQSDVISLLSALPETIRSVELSWLEFLDNSGTWYSFLEELRQLIRDNMLWPDRDTASRPKVTIGVNAHPPRAGRGVWVEKEVQDFLYGEGDHPFYSHAPRGVRKGVGIEKDTFEPNHERPHADWMALERDGYIQFD